jgi:glucosamine kinase
MILIADSGSTKTEWTLILQDKQIVQAKTRGISPYYQSIDEMALTIEDELVPQIEADVKEVFFYGTGCSVQENCLMVQQAIKRSFPLAEVSVSHDLLAAGRALCGNQAGIVCILGTGSNARFYDGQDVSGEDYNLGFMLGDEGSGSYLGKLLVTAYLHQELPKKLMNRFAEDFPKVNRKEVLENIYQKPFPNRYLAEFAKFILQNLREPYCYQLVYDSFVSFFDKYVCKIKDYKRYPVHFTGSIAHYYGAVLRQVANDKGIVVGNILENPIKGLTLYHVENESVHV